MIRRILSAVVFVALYAVAAYADAALPAPVGGTVYYSYENYANGSRAWTSANFPSEAELCDSIPFTGSVLWGPGGTSNSPAYASYWSGGYSGGTCSYVRYHSTPLCTDPEHPHCTLTGTKNYPMIAQAGQVCAAANSQVIGSGPTATCACKPGFVEDGSSCVPEPTDTCEQMLRTESISNCLDSTGCSWPLAEDQRKACLSQPGRSCVVSFGFRSKSHSGQWWGSDTSIVEGPCTEDPLAPANDDPLQTDTPSPCQKGLCPGSINGANVCVPCGSSEGVGSKTTNADGSTVEEKTSCSNGSCTTTTTTKDAAGIPQTVQSRQEPISDYCSRFPLSGHCSGSTNSGGGQGQGASSGSGSGYGQHSGSGGQGGDCTGPDCGDGDSSFGGNCAARFTCSGDAVQCAIAQDQHIRHCQLFEDENPLATVGTEGMTGLSRPDGHPALAPDATAVAFSSLIDQSSPIGAGGCPSDVTAGRFVIPLASACGSFQLLGNILLALTMLAAVFIVFKG